MKHRNPDEFLNQLDEAVYGKRPKKKTTLNENEKITLEDFEEQYANPQVHTLEANRERWEQLINNNFKSYTDVKIDMFDNVLNAFIYYGETVETNGIILKDAIESLHYYILASDLKLEDNWNIHHPDGTIEFGIQLKKDNDELLPIIDLIPNKSQKNQQIEESEENTDNVNNNANYTDLLDAMIDIHPSYHQFNSTKFNKIISNFFLEEGYVDDITLEYDDIRYAIDFYIADEDITIKDLAERINEFYKNNYRDLEQYEFNESVDVVEDEDGDKVFYDYDRWYAELDRIHDEFSVDPVPNEQHSFEATTPDHDIIGKWYKGHFGKIFEPEVIAENILERNQVDLINIVQTVYQFNKSLASKKFGYVLNVIGDFLYDNGYLFDKENMTNDDIKKGIKKSLKHYEDEIGFVKELCEYYNKNRSLYESQHNKKETVEEDSDELSDSESEKLEKKREEIIKDLKDQKDSFKERYGDEWESVMYGTATNIAKKELGIAEGKVSPKNYKMIVESEGQKRSFNVKASCKLMADVKSKKYCDKKGFYFKNIIKK
ncbi:hypothetical protein PBI_SCTP2_457 [Salicola phage SCTP-2]|nr:hypothetical protein PBI_SCTP2_457 [Salicola phage SCTP-2]